MLLKEHSGERWQMKMENRTREGLLLQVRDIEQASRIKLVGEIMKRDDLRDWLSREYSGMGNDIEDLLTFMYKEIGLYKRGLVVLVDGGSSASHRTIMSTHIAYFAIMDELLSNRIVNLDNMLVEVPFNSVANDGVSFDNSYSMRSKMMSPHVLMVNGLNCAVIHNLTVLRSRDGSEGANVSAEERLVIFMDQVISERMSAGKVTIFTLTDEYKALNFVASKMGTHLNEYFMRLLKSVNDFDSNTLQSRRYCRVCLITKEIKSVMAWKDPGAKRRIEFALSTMKIECDDLDKIISGITDACDSLSKRDRRVDQEAVMNALCSDLERCMKFGDVGTESAIVMLEMARSSPKLLAILRGNC